MNQTAKGTVSAKTGVLSIPPERRNPTSPFRDGMAVKILGPDPDNSERVFISMPGAGRLSFLKQYVVET